MKGKGSGEHNEKCVLAFFTVVAILFSAYTEQSNFSTCGAKVLKKNTAISLKHCFFSIPGDINDRPDLDFFQNSGKKVPVLDQLFLPLKKMFTVLLPVSYLSTDPVRLNELMIS